MFRQTYFKNTYLIFGFIYSVFQKPALWRSAHVEPVPGENLNQTLKQSVSQHVCHFVMQQVLRGCVLRGVFFYDLVRMDDQQNSHAGPQLCLFAMANVLL